MVNHPEYKGSNFKILSSANLDFFKCNKQDKFYKILQNLLANQDKIQETKELFYDYIWVQKMATQN